MKRREIARHPGTLLLLALTSAGLTACGSAPEALVGPEGVDLDVERIPARARAVHDPARAVHDPARAVHDPARAVHDPARAVHDPSPAAVHDPAPAVHGPAAAARPPSTRRDAGAIEASSARTGGDRVYFNVTEEAAGITAPAPGATLADRPEDRLAFLAGLPEDQLIAELASRYAREWTLLSGGIGGAAGAEDLDPDLDPRVNEVARRLVLLGLLRPGRAAGEAEPLGEALAFAMGAERSAEQRLIAAAYLEGAGQTGEARAVLRDLWPAEAEEAGGARSTPARDPFGVDGLAFATSIEGPGKYTPAPASQIAPGNLVLVYGEFRDFRSVEEEGPDGPSYARAFAASLRLFSPAGKEVDRLDFLPESRGRQLAKEAVETVNFWARYRIPAQLEPGKHRLVIEARDVLGNASATGELELDL